MKILSFFFIVQIITITLGDPINETDKIIIEQRNKDLGETSSVMIKSSEYIREQTLLEIARKVKQIETQIFQCLDHKTRSAFSTYQIELCTGKDYEFVKLDINYIKRQITGRISQSIRQVLLAECYKKAGFDESQSLACDELQRDAIDLLWNDFDFQGVLKLNKSKYLIDIVEMDSDIFEKLMIILAAVHADYQQFIEALEIREKFLILSIQKYVDRKTKLIIAESQEYPDAPKPLIYTHHISVREQLSKGKEIISKKIQKRDKRVNDIYFPQSQFKTSYEFNTELIKQQQQKKQQLLEQNAFYHELLQKYKVDQVEEIEKEMRAKFGDSYIPKDEVKKQK